MTRFMRAPLGLKVLVALSIVSLLGWLIILGPDEIAAASDLSSGVSILTVILIFLLVYCIALTAAVFRPSYWLRPLAIFMSIFALFLHWGLISVTEEYGVARLFPIAVMLWGIVYLTISSRLISYFSNSDSMVIETANSKDGAKFEAVDNSVHSMKSDEIDASKNSFAKGVNLVVIDDKFNTKWHRISIEKAKNHPLYGVGGWLALFAISLGLGLLKGLGDLGSEAAKYEASLFDIISAPGGGFVAFALLAGAIQVLTVYYLMYSKSPLFRNVSSALLLFGEPLVWCVGVGMSIPGWGREIAEGSILWVISCSIWVTYLQRSKRVRVTFENTVQSESNSNSSKSNPQEPTREPLQTDESLWGQALNEFEGKNRSQGLWAKSFAEAEGDESKAKAYYIKERVRQLSR
jgi:hypothetical protein